jgi:hypothetical protein
VIKRCNLRLLPWGVMQNRTFGVFAQLTLKRHVEALRQAQVALLTAA